MKLKPFKRVPLFVALAVIVAVCLVRWFKVELIEQLEAKTYDLRVRAALNHPAPVAGNLGFVFIQDKSIAKVNDGSLGYRYGLYWPRQIYGRVARELSAQGAKAVGLDVLFVEPRRDHSPVLVNTNQHPDILTFLAQVYPNQPLVLADDMASVESDDFFAWQIRKAGQVILAAEKDALPLDLFRANAFAIGHISAEKDSDGILRRAQAFQLNWHPVFEKAAADAGLDLQNARIERGQISLRKPDGKEISIPLDNNGNFDLADFVGEKIPAGWPRHDKPFERIWHMGIVLAAQELKIDLSKAGVDLPRGKIVLRGQGGIERTIPVDANGYFYVDWRLTPDDARLTSQPVETLLENDKRRSEGRLTDTTTPWKNKIVVVGSIATGNDLSDRGATPLQKDTVLVSKHWNVANSIITGQFIRRTSLAMDLALIFILGVLTAILTWQLRALSALVAVLAAAALYIGFCFYLFVQYRFWLPIFLPVAGSMLVMQGLLVTWRVVFEQAEKRRIKSVFSKIVSPNVVNELLKAESVALGGARREITVFFADVRGFTQLTDQNREKAAEHVKAHNLSGEAAEEIFDRQARETLDTVNLYLALVADTIKKHDGTLDKYIGDCVMAFWGAPAPQPQHALACVKAAIETQRSIWKLNRQRSEENQRREIENAAGAAAGQPARPLLPVLMLGCGINSGIATVGLMGSDAHILNYTVFGREVNLASRLESLSGHSRILIGEPTYAQILRDDPALAATCLALPPATVKGFRDAVKVYEVPWRTESEALADQTEFGNATTDETFVTRFIRHRDE